MEEKTNSELIKEVDATLAGSVWRSAVSDVQDEIRREKARQILRDLLSRRFGPLSWMDQKYIATGTARERDAWLESALDADSLAEALQARPMVSYADSIRQDLRPDVERRVRPAVERMTALRILQNLLVHRFGPLCEEDRDRIGRSTVQELDAWTEAVLDASSVTEILRRGPKGSGIRE